MPAFPLLWIPATIAAATFQVGRNALQRGVMGAAGPWGATLVRFLFGLPVSLALAALAHLAGPTTPHAGTGFWLSATFGATTQVLATAALLVAMHRTGFAAATAMQQSSLPLAALVGLLAWHDRLSPVAWLGVAVTTAGLVVLTWPGRPSAMPRAASGAVFGLASGLFFGISLNAFRHAALFLDASHPVAAALDTLCVVQAMQATVLTLILLCCDRNALRAILRDWRRSLGAGACGGCASAGWFVALTLSPAAPVRALGVIEAPIAAIAGHRLFRETPTAPQIMAGVAVIAGVVLTSLW